jgi:hypothetical protein
MPVRPATVRQRPRAGVLQPGALLLLAAAAFAGGELVSGCGSGGGPEHAAGIPSNLVSQARPIGRSERFHAPARGAVIGPCRSRLGPRQGVHVELFAANRVVLLPAGIGTAAPRTLSHGRIASARCYGALVTLDPTGLVLVRPGVRMSLSNLFAGWGEPLSSTRLGPFAAADGGVVAVFVDGRPWRGRPQKVPLRRHAEIVLEVGPRVPPHASYAFPPGT